MTFKRKTLRRPGFTLIELLVVIAIVALLLSILTPSLMKAKSLTMRLKCAHNLRQINFAIGLYLDANEDTYPCAQDPVSKDPFYCLWMGRGWRSFVAPYLDTYINKGNPSVLLCPQDPTEKDKYEATSYAYSMAFYHSPEQIDAMNCTEKHEEQLSTPVPSMPQRNSNVDKPSGKILIGEWDSNHLPVEKDDRWWCRGWWSRQGRRNYLFTDGHVNYLKSESIREARDGRPNPNMTVHGIKGLDWPR